jgi:hypothetical protein
MRQTLISFAVGVSLLLGTLATTFVPTSASAYYHHQRHGYPSRYRNYYHQGHYYRHRGYYHHHYRYW